MKNSQFLLLALLMTSFSTLSSAPLGVSPQMHAQTQKSENLSDGKSIVLGRFTDRKSADLQLNSLLDFMDTRSKIVDLELAHGFDYAVKEDDGGYTLSIEPFVDDKVLDEALSGSLRGGVQGVRTRGTHPLEPGTKRNQRA